jgi:hypothetical protein
VTLSVLGWLVAHYFTDKRAKSSKKRELVLEYLINAFRVLGNEVSHRELNIERERNLENIVTDIQLFGSPKQVELAKDLSKRMANEKFCGLDDIVNDLRDTLRSELGLKKVNGNISHLRINSKN